MKMFIFAIGASDRASSRLRTWDHVDWLKAQGHQVVIDSLVPGQDHPDRARLARRLFGRYLAWAREVFVADAIMVQEVLLLWPILLLRNIGRRRTLVFDFSDPVDRHGRGMKLLARRAGLAIMMRIADVVQVENERYLARIPDSGTRKSHFFGPVNASRYAKARAAIALGQADKRLHVGWTGSPATLCFIEPLFPILDELARDIPFDLTLIGVQQVAFSFTNIKPCLLDWSESTEFAELPQFDLGLFRLEETEDARWRGAGKLFIYMAAGVPFIASDLGIGADLMRRSSLGFPVASDNDWRETLRQVLLAPIERREQVAPSMAFARDELSYEIYRTRLVELLRSSKGRAYG